MRSLREESHIEQQEAIQEHVCRELAAWDRAQIDHDHAKSKVSKSTGILIGFIWGLSILGFLFCVGAMVKAVLTR